MRLGGIADAGDQIAVHACRHETLDPALITLDDQLPEELWAEAADELNALLADDDLYRWLIDVFSARPLTDDADPTGAYRQRISTRGLHLSDLRAGEGLDRDRAVCGAGATERGIRLSPGHHGSVTPTIRNAGKRPNARQGAAVRIAQLQLELTSEAIRQNLEDGSAWAQHGDAPLASQHLPEALAADRQTMAEVPNDRVARNGCASVLLLQGRYDEILALLP